MDATMYPLKIAGRFAAVLMFHFSLLVRHNSKQAILYSRFPWTVPVFSFVLIFHSHVKHDFLLDYSIKRGYDTKFQIKSKWSIFIINPVNDFEKKRCGIKWREFFWKKNQKNKAEGTTNLKETIISFFSSL